MRDRFLRDILANPRNETILARWNDLALPDGWLVAGCLFQTVWNVSCGQHPEAKIKDYDLFYFDAEDLTEEGEKGVQAHIDQALLDLRIVAEAKNQARVHIWYPEHFDFPYPTLQRSRDGIDRFLVAETCVGVRPSPGGLELYAPNGLEGLYEGVLSPNPLMPDQRRFRMKAHAYQNRWRWLRIRE